MRRLVLFAIVAFLIAGDAFSQEPPIDLEPTRQGVRELLWSPFAKDQAWGAYLVGDLNFAELGPELIEFIEGESAAGFDGDREYILRAAVDSMIRLEISPPAGLLDPFVDVIRDELVILYARNPVPYSALLLRMLEDEKRDAPRRHALFAAAREANTPGLAAWLLQDVEINATLWIVTGQVGPGSANEAGGGVVELVSGRPRPADFPPDIVYRLDYMVGPASKFLVQGIYFNRFDFTGGAVKPFLRVILDLDVLERFDYIAALAGFSSRRFLPLKHSYIRKVLLPEGADFAADRKALIAEIEADYGRVVRSLLDQGVIDADERLTFSPKINLTIRDQR